VNRLRDRRSDDAGYSLIEVVVAAGMFAVILSIVTTAILQVFRTSETVESRAVAQSDLQLAFQRFDRELRYASWISAQGTQDTAVYVEFASSDGTECLQLRLETEPAEAANPADGRGVLQLLRWTPGTPPAKNTPGQTIASHLVTDGLIPPVDPSAFAVPEPFIRQGAGTTPYSDTSDLTTDFQRLRIQLTTKVGTAVSAVDTTFTALNTSRTTPANHTCGEGRPT
jgi:type II secretory pathway pseudopilin PulG